MKNSIKNKKGITLVELIVASAISVIIMAAACSMFYVGSKSAQQGADEYINHGNAYILEKQLRNNLFEASEAAVYTDAGSLPSPNKNSNIVEIYFDASKTLLVKTESTDSEQRSYVADDDINEIKLEKKVYKVSNGSNNINVKPTVNYTITVGKDKTSLKLSGGMTMNNAADSSLLTLPNDAVTITNTDTNKYFVITVPRK